MRNILKGRKLLLFVGIMITLALYAVPAFAADSIWDELETYTSDPALQKEAAQTVAPVIRFAFFIFAVLATLGAVIVAFRILIQALKVRKGKESFEKRWILETAAVLLIFIIIGSGTWVQFFKTGQKLIVEPATDIIIKEYDGNSPAASTTTK
ncbi:hypothetical protein DFR58_1472 [Anaerobacterium chartisolvens]|uniref:Uncharacterized protein n=1 Tax=Anaerobacterium chartisolvens TaxID=1297424 RepID=A0A369AEV3_9FIRM|nr:hypothetical protein [Anaerobacterium chartisolvens]RCX07882.1 hypothetical protein DFR58_1472 [Anaerobacterium chartisolvens]